MKLKNMKRLKFLLGCLFLFVTLLNTGISSINKLNGLTLSHVCIIANADTESDCVSHPDGFCKNNPSINDGICVEEIHQVCCKKTSQSNRDCYDIGL
jgi:hypothetical protein